MCYPHPAPRCSTVAKRRLRKAQSGFTAAIRSHEFAFSVAIRTELDLADARQTKQRSVINRAKAAVARSKKRTLKVKAELEAARNALNEAQKQFDMTTEGIEVLRRIGDPRADLMEAERRILIAQVNTSRKKPLGIEPCRPDAGMPISV